MTRQNGLAVVGIVLVALLGVALLRSPEPVKAADERGFNEKAAVKVMMKNQTFEYMTWPEIRRLAGRAFVVGYRVNTPATVWLPVDDVSSIEEYTNLDEMIKVYPGLAKKN